MSSPREPGRGAGRPGVGDRLVPALLVRDLEETLAFYRLLGFRQTGRFPRDGAATWAEVRRDGVVFQFHTEPPCGTPATPTCSGTFYLFPESVAAVAAELEGKVELAWGPETMDYGMHELGVRDPNGYHIAFSEPASGDAVA